MTYLGMREKKKQQQQQQQSNYIKRMFHIRRFLL